MTHTLTLDDYYDALDRLDHAPPRFTIHPKQLAYIRRCVGPMLRAEQSRRDRARRAEARLERARWALRPRRARVLLREGA